MPIAICRTKKKLNLNKREEEMNLKIHAALAWCYVGWTLRNLLTSPLQ